MHSDAPTQEPAQQSETFETSPAVAMIELDRFCESCGYNLRHQQVRREPHTKILMIRCPECGSFAPAAESVTAGKKWVRRLSMVLLLTWVMMVVAMVVGLMSAQLGIATLTDDATRYGTLDAEDWFYITLLSLLLAGGTLVAFTILAAAFSHWRTRSFLILAALLPVPALLLGLTIVVLEISSYRSNLALWSCLYAAVVFVAGLLGALYGRNLARLLLRLVLPKNLRAGFAHVWLADGLEPPNSEEKK